MPKTFSLEPYDDDGHFGIGDGVRVRLEFEITRGAGKHLLESPLSVDQSTTMDGDLIWVRATFMDTNRLHWWLQGFGDEVTDIRRDKV